MKGFARREFQLMLLRRMADFQPELVSAAHAQMGATHADYMAAHNRWQSMLRSRRSPRGLDLYEAVLGPADRRRSERLGDVTVTAHWWRLLGLWPQLGWETLVAEGGTVLNGWLVRDAEGQAPEPRTPDRFAPWSAVVGDIQARFPDARQADPQIPSQWLAFVKDPDGKDPDGPRWRLVFVHGLLQAATLSATD